MSLITPDFGLLVWMTLIFAIVFFVLAKFGFPAITSMVDKRSARIEDALKKADEAEKRLSGLAQEHDALMEKTKLEQSRMLKEASQLNLPKDQAEGLINQHLDTVKSDLSVASMLLNSDTSKEDVQALADMAQKLTKMNPSYAKLPEAQVLNSKIELAKVYSSWLEKSNDNFQNIYDSTPNSTGKTSKHLEGFYDKKSFKYSSRLPSLGRRIRVMPKRLAWSEISFQKLSAFPAATPSVIVMDSPASSSAVSTSAS